MNAAATPPSPVRGKSLLSIRAAGQSRIQATAIILGLIGAFAFHAPVFAACYLAVALVVVALNYRVFDWMDKKERVAVFLTALVPLLVLPVSTTRSITAGLHYGVELASLALALILTRNLVVYRKACQLTLGLAQVSVLAFLAHTGLAGFPLENILPESSSNGVTSYLIVLQANYCLINYLMTRRVSFISTTVTLFICIVGFGRGSFIAAVAITGLGVLAKIPSRRYHRMMFSLVLVTIGGLAVYGNYRNRITDYVMENTKIGNGVVDPVRLTILKEYWAKINPVTFWFGADYSGTSIVSEHNGNPHNSFIRGHYIFGFPYLLLILFLPVYLFRWSHPLPVKIYSAGLAFVVFFRSFTEPILFPTLLDFFYFASCFALSKRLSPPNSKPPMQQPRLCLPNASTTITSI